MFSLAFSLFFLGFGQVLIQGFLVGSLNGHAIGACPDIAELFCRFAMLLEFFQLCRAFFKDPWPPIVHFSDKPGRLNLLAKAAVLSRLKPRMAAEAMIFFMFIYPCWLINYY